jgi:nucleotide-binding universal stress UspA family protein
MDRFVEPENDKDRAGAASLSSAGYADSRRGAIQSPLARDVMRILVAIDGSECSQEAVQYVGGLLRETREVQLTLFHVLKPLPRELLEHGGSENPNVGAGLSRRLRTEQEEWVKAESAIEYPILLKALEAAVNSGFPIDRVTLKFGYEDDVGRNILEEARAGAYGTVVVSRDGRGGMKRLFRNRITDHLLHEGTGITLWIVG